ncbi:MAG: O-antigen ligase family protein [Actinomycetota bacterium]
MTSTVVDKRTQDRRELTTRRRSALSGRQLRVLTPFAILAVVGLAIQVPRYQYNLTPSDASIVVFLLLAAVSFWRSRLRIRLPLSAGFTLSLLGGTVAVTQSIVPRESISALLQDLYLFSFFLLTVNLIAQAPEKFVRRVAVVWALVATGAGIFTWIVASRCPGNIPVVFGHATATPFCRVSGTLFDENLNGYFLVIGLFVVWAAPWPRRLFGKAILTVPIVFGIYETQSITALIALVAGVIATAAVSFVSRRQAAAAATILVLAIAVIGVAALPPDFERDPSSALETIGTKGSAFEGSFGRSDASFSGRTQRWREALQFFGGSLLIGIGPSSTDNALAAQRAPIGGELHNDYVAGFLERGIVGGVGVLLLFGAAAAWAMRVAIDDGLRRRGWRPPAFAGAMIAVLLTAITLETLHFRHQWLLFALVIGLGLRQERAADSLAS